MRALLYSILLLVAVLRERCRKSSNHKKMFILYPFAVSECFGQLCGTGRRTGDAPPDKYINTSYVNCLCYKSLYFLRILV